MAYREPGLLWTRDDWVEAPFSGYHELMLTVLSSIGVAIAGGAVGAAIVVFLLFAVRQSIMAAFAQTAARELEMMRARYSESLEDKRQQFARELEQGRQNAARAL